MVRFATPDPGTVAFDDVIRGTVSFECSNLEDFVIARSDGSVTFLIANAIDDAAMGITHVVRGEDLLNTTPKAVLLRRAMGIEDQPVFAHPVSYTHLDVYKRQPTPTPTHPHPHTHTHTPTPAP